MKDLKHNWLHILPSRMYNLSVCMLIQVLCQTVLQRVFANSQAVDEDIIYMIAVRLEDIKQEVLELFEVCFNLFLYIKFYWWVFYKIVDLLFKETQ